MTPKGDATHTAAEAIDYARQAELAARQAINIKP